MRTAELTTQPEWVDLITQRSVVQIAPPANGVIKRLAAPIFLVPNLVLDLPIHCRIIRTCCNAIQTLLQVNSNNYNRTAGSLGFSV
jgi:hypothetical protein